MANLYTFMLIDMKKKISLPDHYKGIVKKLNTVLKTIEGMQEDPLFIDNIHGEQELNLDQSIELFKGIKVLFEPEPEAKDDSPEYEAASFDITRSYSLAPNTMRKQTYLPTADNEVEVRRQLIQAKYGGGGNTEDLLALAINNQLTDITDYASEYDVLKGY